MRLNTIKPAAGSKKPKRRVARGIGSGHGKTAGRGHKGQKSRSGGFHKVGFEGGQMPLQRRLPKRGFVSMSRDDTAEVRLADLARLPVAEIDLLALKAAGMVPAQLKARFGDRLVFWGAADVQDFLRTATPDEVTAGIHELVATLGGSGGYILAPAHNLQDDVPADNIVAMVEAVRQMGG